MIFILLPFLPSLSCVHLIRVKLSLITSDFDYIGKCNITVIVATPVQRWEFIKENKKVRKKEKKKENKNSTKKVIKKRR